MKTVETYVFDADEANLVTLEELQVANEIFGLECLFNAVVCLSETEETAE